MAQIGDEVEIQLWPYILEDPKNLYKALTAMALTGVVDKFLCIYKYKYNIFKFTCWQSAVNLLPTS